MKREQVKTEEQTKVEEYFRALENIRGHITSSEEKKRLSTLFTLLIKNNICNNFEDFKEILDENHYTLDEMQFLDMSVLQNFLKIMDINTKEKFLSAISKRNILSLLRQGFGEGLSYICRNKHWQLDLSLLNRFLEKTNAKRYLKKMNIELFNLFIEKNILTSIDELVNLLSDYIRYELMTVENAYDLLEPLINKGVLKEIQDLRDPNTSECLRIHAENPTLLQTLVHKKVINDIFDLRSLADLYDFRYITEHTDPKLFIYLVENNYISFGGEIKDLLQTYSRRVLSVENLDIVIYLTKNGLINSKIEMTEFLKSGLAFEILEQGKMSVLEYLFDNKYIENHNDFQMVYNDFNLAVMLRAELDSLKYLTAKDSLALTKDEFYELFLQDHTTTFVKSFSAPKNLKLLKSNPDWHIDRLDELDILRQPNVCKVISSGNTDIIKFFLDNKLFDSFKDFFNFLDNYNQPGLFSYGNSRLLSRIYKTIVKIETDKSSFLNLISDFNFIQILTKAKEEMIDLILGFGLKLKLESFISLCQDSSFVRILTIGKKENFELLLQIIYAKYHITKDASILENPVLSNLIVSGDNQALKRLLANKYWKINLDELLTLGDQPEINDLLTNSKPYNLDRILKQFKNASELVSYLQTPTPEIVLKIIDKMNPREDLPGDRLLLKLELENLLLKIQPSFELDASEVFKGVMDDLKATAITYLLYKYIVEEKRSPVFSDIIITSYSENKYPEQIHDLGIPKTKYKYVRGKDFINLGLGGNLIFFTHSDSSEQNSIESTPIISQSVLQNTSKYVPGEDGSIPFNAFFDTQDRNTPRKYESYESKDRGRNLERTLRAMMWSVLCLENLLLRQANDSQ